jgi:outer membrane protein, heavy metal efflux system
LKVKFVMSAYYSTSHSRDHTHTWLLRPNFPQLRRTSFMLLALLLGTTWTFSQGIRLDLAEALQKAAVNHPAIKAAGARIASAEGLLQQARLKPNPSLSFQSENWRMDGAPAFRPGQELDTFLYLSQPLETGGKRSRRSDEAQKEIALARAEQEALQWKIRQEVRLAFQRALLAQEQMKMMKEGGKDLDQIVDYHRLRVEQGATAEADLIKVRLERERYLLAESAAEAEAERSLLDVLRAMGEPVPYPPYQLAEIPDPAAGNPLSENELRLRAVERRPDLRLARLHVERAQAALEMQKALAKPDVGLVMGYKRTGGYDTLLAGVTVSLPWFDRNQGHVAHGLSELQRSELLHQAAQLHANAEISSAVASVRRKHAMIHQMETGVVERASESWRISLAAYQEGGTDLLHLLDAQRVLREVRLLQSRIRMEFRLSVMELEGAVGDENFALAEDISSEKP